jgi:hypothetical protein
VVEGNCSSISKERNEHATAIAQQQKTHDDRLRRLCRTVSCRSGNLNRKQPLTTAESPTAYLCLRREDRRENPSHVCEKKSFKLGERDVWV